MTALQLRFRYLVVRMRNRPSQLILWVVLLVAFFCVIHFYWLRVFPLHEVTLLKAAGYGLIPFFLAVAGNHFAAEVIREPKKRFMWRVVFVVLGLAGVLIVPVVEKKIDDDHAFEVGALTTKLGTVQEGNTAILQHLTTHPLINKQDEEVSRRQDVLTLLRHEWILSHKNISPGLFTGTEEPPSDWVNQRLRQLGEAWSVEDTRSKSQNGTTQPVQQIVPFYGNLKQRSATLAYEINELVQYRRRVYEDALKRPDYSSDGVHLSSVGNLKWSRMTDEMFRNCCLPDVYAVRDELAKAMLRDKDLDEKLYWDERLSYLRNSTPPSDSTVGLMNLNDIQEIARRILVLSNQLPQ